MRQLLTQLRPSNFEDIVAVLALYRPGPLESGMVEQFIKRKHGKEPIKYLHPALEPILKDTYGVIVYQEQVMQIAQALAGYTLGDADSLRRAMGTTPLVARGFGLPGRSPSALSNARCAPRRSPAAAYAAMSAG